LVGTFCTQYTYNLSAAQLPVGKGDAPTPTHPPLQLSITHTPTRKIIFIFVASWDLSVDWSFMKNTIAVILFCAATAGALAEEKTLTIRPSVWGTQKWPGGYELYRGNVKTGELKASVWGQDTWVGGYELETR
jgi:hypothetical protein